MKTEKTHGVAIPLAGQRPDVWRVRLTAPAKGYKPADWSYVDEESARLFIERNSAPDRDPDLIYEVQALAVVPCGVDVPLAPSTYAPSREVVQQALELVDRIRDSHASWGGWSGIPQTCERITNMLRYGSADGVGAVQPQQSERVPCSRCTSDIYCEMNGCQRPRPDGVKASDDLSRMANMPEAARRDAMYREADPLCFVCSGSREHPRDAGEPCPNCARGVDLPDGAER